MTNQQILEKAIQKVIDGGWKPFEMGVPNPEDFKYIYTVDEYTETVDFQVVYNELNKTGLHEWSIYKLIFNHDFAKAVWGEDKIVSKDSVWGADWHGWQYHLQQMVLEEDPIKYLGENI